MHSLSKESRDHIATNCCVNVAGHVLPSMIIYEKAFSFALYKVQGPSNTLYTKSLNGYIDEEWFFSWFKFFIAKTQHLGKIMLIIDVLGFHISFNVIDTGKKNNIVLYYLPPHIILQPFDMSVYKPMKNHFISFTDFIILARVTLNEKILIVFREAFNKTMTVTTTKSGF